MPRHRLYHFGRSALWLFAILLIEGIVLSMNPSLMDIQDAPAFFRHNLGILITASIAIGFLGVVTSLGLIFRKEWSRYLMALLLVLGSLGVLILAVSLMKQAFSASEMDFGAGGKTEFLIVAPLVCLVMIGGMGVGTWYVLTKHFR